jgi:hypothetical protein
MGNVCSVPLGLLSHLLKYGADTNNLLSPHLKSVGRGRHGGDVGLAVVGSFLLWTDIYLLLRLLNRRCSAEWNCRTITALHGALSASLCLISAVIVGPWPFSYVGEKSTEFHTVIMVISLGYFLFDFLWCLYMRTEGPVMLAHHVVSLLGLAYVLNQGRYGSELTAVMGASECTNPLLQLRWFMRETGHYTGRKALLVDYLFVSLFLAARLGAGSVFHYVCQTSPKLNLIIKAGGQAFYIISVIFGIQLCMFFYRKYLKKKRSKREN